LAQKVGNQVAQGAPLQQRAHLHGAHQFVWKV
jgi:hypothetical protein